MQTETQKHLAKAKKMIQDPEHWTQHCKARDKDGSITGADSPNRHSICLITSLQLTRQDFAEYGQTMFDLAEIIDDCNDDSYTTIANFNDTNPHSEVMDLLDKAINQ